MHQVRKYGRAMLLVVAAGLIAQQAAAAGEPAGSPAAHHAAARLSLERENPSENTLLMAQWILESGDSKGMPFVIVDKVDARVFVFKADGSLSGATPALMGLAKGDDSIPGIGTRKMSSILPEERTTPAGRYVASLGRNIQGKGILWVDYEAAFSLHPVVTSNPKESRAQRLATPTTLDNRISYGCINVPAKFYAGVVNPAFKQSSGVVYVLPETRPLQAVFAGFGVAPRAHPKAAGSGQN